MQKMGWLWAVRGHSGSWASQLKSCQLQRNSSETTYTTSPEQIQVIKLEGRYNV